VISLSLPFLYLWVYEVLPGRADDFLELYGPIGSWVALFRRADGYPSTELLLDRTVANRFLTIDRWESHDAFARFRNEFSKEFDRLDRLGEQMTSREILLGEFTPAVFNPGL
jgi:heme-degrading monooxygenase HmoA